MKHNIYLTMIPVVVVALFAFVGCQSADDGALDDQAEEFSVHYWGNPGFADLLEQPDAAFSDCNCFVGKRMCECVDDEGDHWMAELDDEGENLPGRNPAEIPDYGENIPGIDPEQNPDAAVGPEMDTVQEENLPGINPADIPDYGENSMGVDPEQNPGDFSIGIAEFDPEQNPDNDDNAISGHQSDQSEQDFSLYGEPNPLSCLCSQVNSSCICFVNPFQSTE
ncbi:MAG: hypothetical protein P9M14_10665 [Candidatus Alcyoniella australis]|nr:hypothetical protein [Candidatus Alcyoniella australis]